jgi:hypothetical protein
MPALVHCSYHKCLTVYFKRVMTASVGRFGGYRHFNSDLEAFQRGRRGLRVASVNNQAIDLDSLGDCRVSRFVRDPRDLVVSGYFYHRRGAEPWCLEVDPSEEKWLARRNRPRPSAMRPGESLADTLQRLDLEDGLLAELELRSRHFDSMRDWPADDPRVRVWRYEEILGREERVMRDLAAHYELPIQLRTLVRRNAVRYDVRHAMAGRSAHVRNPAAGQWREVFTPRVERAFMERWGDLLDRYGYAVEGGLERPAGARRPLASSL